MFIHLLKYKLVDPRSYFEYWNIIPCQQVMITAQEVMKEIERENKQNKTVYE